MDFPVTGNFLPEDLYSYPPKMVCRFFLEQGAVSTTCRLTLHGFDKSVSVDMALLVPEPQKIMTVDTTELQLGLTVENIVFFARTLTSALRYLAFVQYACNKYLVPE